MKRIEYDKLLVPRILAGLGEQPPSPQEALTRIANSGLPKAIARNMMASMGASLLFAATARTAILYLVDGEEWVAALNSGGEDPTGVLPPMPFKRIAVEARENHAFPIGAHDNPHMMLEAFTITSTENGWYVVMIGHDPDTEPDDLNRRMLCHVFHIERATGGVLVFAGNKTGEGLDELLAAAPNWQLTKEQAEGSVTEMRVDDDRASPYRRFATETVHLITARGVQLVGVQPDRAERRRFTKRHGSDYPRMYFVQIGGDTIVRGGTEIARQYRHRWLVRGHYRHFEDGSRTWVRSYIKGPAGAPWKGRPTYVVAA